MNDRKKNSRMKIWEKNKPSREGILRKICDTDIDESEVLVHPRLKKYMDNKNDPMTDKNRAFQSGLESKKKKENRYKLIERKREMFLVVQMLSIKQKEIATLEEYQKLRDEGLKFSEQLLHTDITNFIEFFK